MKKLAVLVVVFLALFVAVEVSADDIVVIPPCCGYVQSYLPLVFGGP